MIEHVSTLPSKNVIVRWLSMAVLFISHSYTHMYVINRLSAFQLNGTNASSLLSAYTSTSLPTPLFIM